MIERPAIPGTSATILYLGAPVALFLLLFVRPIIGLPLLAFLFVAGWYVLRSLPAERGFWLPAWVGAFAVALIVGFPNGPYAWDWVKHWALLQELSDHSWPFALDLQGKPQFLRYYVGAYLVPAWVHGLIPQIPLWIPTALWFGLGFALFLRMVASVGIRPQLRWLAVLLFLQLGGADVYGQLGYRLLDEYPTPLTPMLGLHHESWMYNAQNVPLEFSSFITALAWVPHQAIATFLVAGLLIVPVEQRRFPAILLAFGALALWSPYGLLGLLPLMLVATYQHRAELARPVTLFAGASGAALALLVAWYLSTDLPKSGACLACMPDRLAQFYEFAPFLTIELAPFVLMLGKRIVHDVMCRTAAATLIVIPMMYGAVGDFVMRASLGPLLVLGVLAIQSLLTDWPAGRRRLFHAAAIVLCSPTAISEMIYLRTAGRAHFAYSVTDPLRAAWLTDFAQDDRFSAVEFFERCGWRYLPQYFTVREPQALKPVVPDASPVASPEGAR